MLTLFKLLFRKTARNLATQSYKQGFGNGFKLGREYQEQHNRLFVSVIGANVEKDVDEILRKEGF